MYAQEKISMVVMAMKRYNINVLGIAETRWIQSGPFRLATEKLIVTKLWTDTLSVRCTRQKGALSLAESSWEPVSSRLITAAFWPKDYQIYDEICT